MIIKRIAILGLFDRFDHFLDLDEHEPITVIHGPNGFGKTACLRLINALFQRSLSEMKRLPFHKMSVLFSDETVIEVTREVSATQDGRPDTILKLGHGEGAAIEEQVWAALPIDPDDLDVPLGAIEELVPGLSRLGAREWQDLSTSEILDLGSVVERYGEHLGRSTESQMLPNWLTNIRGKVPVHFIDTERLFQSTRLTPRRAYRQTPARLERTVMHYARDISEKIKETTRLYGTLSQSLDRSFPARLVQPTPKPEVMNEGELQKRLLEVDQKRARLIDIGLLPDEQEAFQIPGGVDLSKIDKSALGVLSVYAGDSLQKLEVFSDLQSRIETLLRIVNGKLLYKQLTIDQDGMHVELDDGNVLDLDMLSSGEQHELVLLYQLLFKVTPNSLILIDEPELSLHVAWQETFLDDLEEVAYLSQFRALVATHSPQIIGGRWNLTIELKGRQ